MNEKTNHISDSTALPRRRFLFDSLGATLSATSIVLLTGCTASVGARVQSEDQAIADIRILNTALGAEREAIAAYQLGADSELLGSDVLKVAVQFQDHHKAHADALVDAIHKLGGEPAKPPVDYNFPTAGLRGQSDVLEFAAGLERGAVSAYAGAIPLFTERELSKAAASILADEAMHWAVLRSALGLDPVPGAFFS